MNRGSSRKDIFFDDADRDFFLDRLVESSARTEVEVHAYCLMTNHFHLLVRTPIGNLAKMMHLLGGAYARYFHVRYGTDGGLCRGRYRSVLIDSEAHMLGVSRYVHRNPLSFWRDGLETYPWSSYPAYLGLTPVPHWLFVDETLDVAGNSHAYRGMVEMPWPSDVDRFYEAEHVPSILGSDEFANRVKRLRTT